MTEQEKERAPSLVRSFLEPSPTLEFVIKRKQEDGSVVDLPLRCRLLRSDQLIDALEAAQKFAAKREAKGYGDIYREAQAYEVIQRAICRAEPTVIGDRKEYRPYFVSSDQVRQSLDEVECARMLDFIQITKQYYRTENVVEAEDVEKMVEALADEMAGPYFLSHTDSADWPVIIYELSRMVARLWSQSGTTPSSLGSISESDQQSSPLGTGGSQELPDASLTVSGERKPLPKRPVRSRVEAREFVKKQRSKTTPEQPED